MTSTEEPHPHHRMAENKKKVEETQILIGQRILETGKWTYKPASVNASCLPKKM
jgi:antitoxin (DNA-binding transcriptional repressor) of toxin-antitoxin stability system